MSIETLKRRTTNIIREYVEKSEVAGVNVLVLRDGQEVFGTQYGYADVEGKKLFGRDTIFRLYSMSKPITAASAMILMERGQIDLMDPVSKYLSSFAEMTVNEEGSPVAARRPIMVKDLLDMTSGLMYPGDGLTAERQSKAVFGEIDRRIHTENAMTTREVCDALAQCDLAFHPGEHFRYGTSADVLGAVVEAAGGMTFGDFLRKELFGPLEMTDTDFYVPEKKRGRLAKVYRATGTQCTEEQTNNLGIRYACDRQPAFESGGAGLMSTLDDYAHFASMLMHGGVYKGKRILSEAAVRFLCSGRLAAAPQADFDRDWTGLAGYSYGNLMRVMETPGRGVGLGEKGEYGWDGWLGPYFVNAPESRITILIGMQKIDGGTWSLTRKLRNVIFAELL